MEETTQCSHCKAELQSEDIYCPECGYPERADDVEKNKFEHRIMLRKRVLKDSQKKIKNVQILLFILAGINILLGLYYLFILNDEMIFVDGIAVLITGLVFIGCAIWVNNQPLTGILAAFFFWVLLQVLAAIVTPSSIIAGVLLKVIIIGVFLKGISSAKDAKKYADQLAEMKVN